MQGGIRGVMCINADGKVQVTSRESPSLGTPSTPLSEPKLVAGNTLTSTNVQNGIMSCEFSRTLDVPSGSEGFMYDLNTNRFAVYAAGQLTLFNHQPSYHIHGSSNRFTSSNPIDVREFQVYICNPVVTGVRNYRRTHLFTFRIRMCKLVRNRW